MNTDSRQSRIVLQTAAATTAFTNPFRSSPPPMRGLCSSSSRNRHHQSFNHSTLHSAVAGYVAGVSGTVVGYPLDSAKVWIQTGGCKNKHMTMLAASNASNSSGLGAAAAVTTTTAPSRPLHTAWQTLRALYSGVSGPLVTVGVVQSLNFAVYDRTRQYLHQQRIQKQQQQDDASPAKANSYMTEDSLSGVATAGFASGMTIACITAPLVMIKTNQQITGNSFRQALTQSLFRQGRLNLSAGAAGFLPHLIGESVGRSIYYFTYEGLKRSWAAAKNTDSGNFNVTNNSINTSISLQERIVCAAMSGITCWAAIFPVDALRSRLYAAAAAVSQHTASGEPMTSSRQLLIGTIRQMRQERVFYRGFGVTVLRAGPVAAAVLPVYDLTLETLSSCHS